MIDPVGAVEGGLRMSGTREVDVSGFGGQLGDGFSNDMTVGL